MKAKCPECGSTNVYRCISIGAKQKINGTHRVYEVGYGGLDGLFESCGCEKCGWTGQLDDIKNIEDCDVD